MDKITDITSRKDYKPIVLVILDGWGLSPSWGGNAISMSNPKNLNLLWRTYPHKILQSFSEIAGPYIKVGNSEIGHMSISGGRMVCHDLVRITKAIEDKTFYKNRTLINSIIYAQRNSSALHLIGLLSDGAVHSHIDHLYALLDLCKMQHFENVFLHLFLDGQDTRPVDALKFVVAIEKKIKELGFGKIATVCGRFYGMDRDNHWERTTRAFQAMTMGIGVPSTDVTEAIKKFYYKGLTDSFIPPIVMMANNKPVGKINENDSIIFFNTRADRARQICRAFVDPDVFRKFLLWRKYPIMSLYFTTLTSYGLRLKVNVAFPPQKIKNNLAVILAQYRLKQLHISESEKYAHVTYFFNGGSEDILSGEERIIIQSPDVVSYDQQPEMSTTRLVKTLTRQIQLKKFDFILVNLPNVDLIGHTGNVVAISKAVLSVDWAIAKIIDAVSKVGGATIVTADHGNAEQMIHLEGGDPETLHSLNPVPFILVARDKRKIKITAMQISSNALSEILAAKNTLADIAPTILEMLNIPKPVDMTGQSLLGKLE